MPKNKKLVDRIKFFLQNPDESILKRIRNYYHNIKGLDFKPDFNLNGLGLSDERANGHEAMQKFNSLAFLFKNLNISQSDSIIDLGCGKGHALVQFSKYPFNKISGVELSKNLCEIAQSNLNILKIKNTSIINADAGKFNDYTNYNYIYLFNPFPCAVVTEVLKNIEHSLQKNPRKLTVIYNHPVCAGLFQSSPFFTNTKKLDYQFKKDTRLQILVFESKTE